MSAGLLLAVGALGGLAALARFALAQAVDARTGARFPFGTLVVNLSGAFALGALVGIAPGRTILLLVATGFLGAFTTFSTWMLDSVRLARSGSRAWSALNLAGSLALGLAVAWAGRELGVAIG